MAAPARCPERWASSAAVTASGRSTPARWAAPAISSRLAPGTASAIRRACAGGVAGSSRPATTRVGAVILSRSAVMSYAARTSQQAA